MASRRMAVGGWGDEHVPTWNGRTMPTFSIQSPSLVSSLLACPNAALTCTMSSSKPSRRSRMRRLRTITSRHRSRPSWCTVVNFCRAQ